MSNREVILQRLPAIPGQAYVHLIFIDNGDGTTSAYIWDTNVSDYPTDPAVLQQIVTDGLISGDVEPLIPVGGVIANPLGVSGFLAVFNGTSNITNSRIQQGTADADPTQIGGPVPNVGQAINLNNGFFDLPTVELIAGANPLGSNIRVRIAGDSFIIVETPGGAGAPTMLLVPNNAPILTDGMGYAVGTVIGQDGDGHSFDIVNAGLFSVVRFTPDGRIIFPEVTGGLSYKEGANARSGVAVLVGGTVTVPNTLVKANTRVLYSVQTVGGVPGFLSYTLVANTSFTLTSTSALDTSTVYWQLFTPAA